MTARRDSRGWRAPAAKTELSYVLRDDGESIHYQFRRMVVCACQQGQQLFRIAAADDEWQRFAQFGRDIAGDAVDGGNRGIQCAAADAIVRVAREQGDVAMRRRGGGGPYTFAALGEAAPHQFDARHDEPAEMFTVRRQYVDGDGGAGVDYTPRAAPALTCRQQRRPAVDAKALGHAITVTHAVRFGAGDDEMGLHLPMLLHPGGNGFRQLGARHVGNLYFLRGSELGPLFGGKCMTLRRFRPRRALCRAASLAAHARPFDAAVADVD